MGPAVVGDAVGVFVVGSPVGAFVGVHPRRLRPGRNSGGGRYRWSSCGFLCGGTNGLRGRRRRSGLRGGRHRRRRGGRVGQILDAVIVRLTRVCHLAAFQLGGVEQTTAVGWQWKGVDAFANGPLRAVVGIPLGRAGRGRAGRRRCGRGRGGDASGDLARTCGLTQVGGAAAIRGGQVRGGVAAGRLGTGAILPSGRVDWMPVGHGGTVWNPLELTPVLLLNGGCCTVDDCR